MGDSDKPKSSGTKDDNTWIYGVGAIVGFICVVPVVVAAALWWLARPYLRRREYGIILAASLVAVAVGGGAMVGDYMSWVGVLVTGSRSRLEIPFPAIAAFSGVLLGVAGLIDGSPIAAKLPAVLKRRENIGGKPSIVPDKAEKNRIVTPPVLTADPTLHSHIESAPVGERPIPLGVDRHGRPVVITEREIGMHGLLFGSTGSGKALALDTPIPTPSGWSTMGELVPGDEVLDEHGRVCRVVFATETQLNRDCYEVVFSDGSTIVADADHRWLTEDPVGTSSVVTTADIFATLTVLGEGRTNHAVVVADALDLPETSLPTAPRELGVQLAHGYGRRVPGRYLRAARPQRLELLRGLLAADTDSDDERGEFVTPSELLALDVRELIHTLGAQTRFEVKPAGADAGGATHRVAFNWSDVGSRLDDRGSDRLRYVTRVRPVRSVPVRCIQVDSPSHLYLAGRSFIPTHNTETIKQVAGGLLDLGWSGMILDLKEDTAPGGLRDWCDLYGSHHAVPYQELRLSSMTPDYWFNPLAGLNQDEARDTILSLMEFDDQYWQNVNKKMLGQLLKAMFMAHAIDPISVPAPTMYDVGRILTSNGLAKATKKLVAIIVANTPGISPADEFSSLVSPTADEAKSATGFGAKIQQIFDTQAGRLVLRPDGSHDGSQRRMLEVTQPGLIYVGLDSQGKPDLTRIISSAVLQRLSVDAAQRTTGTAQVDKSFRRFLIVDEANWVDRTIVQNLLSRARSAGISMILATQGPMDWIDKNGDDFAKLGQNTNVAIIMSQGEPRSAEVCANYLGMVDHMTTTYRQQDGELLNAGSVREETSWRVSPDQLRAMEVGEAIIRVGKPTERVTWAKISQRDPTTSVTDVAPAAPSRRLARPPLIPRPPV